MKSHVEFKTTIFPAYEDEEDLINPGRYGKRLAEFLAEGLSEVFEVEDPVAEDWGWILILKNKDFPLWVGCGNYDDYENGFLCFIEPHTTIVKKFPFKKISTEKTVLKVQKTIDDILSKNSEIKDIKWSSFEEFNNV